MPAAFGLSAFGLSRLREAVVSLLISLRKTSRFGVEYKESCQPGRCAEKIDIHVHHIVS
jgi:hypothetical protein